MSLDDFARGQAQVFGGISRLVFKDAKRLQLTLLVELQKYTKSEVEEESWILMQILEVVKVQCAEMILWALAV